jgi:hypothetical protein
MNNRLSCIAATLLAVSATSVNAASSVDLSVTGVITPAACMPQLSNGGVVDHGKISARDINHKVDLPPVTLRMSVSCDASTFFAVKIIDNREGTVWGDRWNFPSPSLFGLGLSVDDEKLGSYVLMMQNPLADSVEFPLVESVDGKVWFSAQDTQVWQPGWMRSVSAPGNPDHTPVAVKTLEADLVVSTTIYKPKIITQEIPLDGSATLDIVYL